MGACCATRSFLCEPVNVYKKADDGFKEVQRRPSPTSKSFTTGSSYVGEYVVVPDEHFQEVTSSLVFNISKAMTKNYSPSNSLNDKITEQDFLQVLPNTLFAEIAWQGPTLDDIDIPELVTEKELSMVEGTTSISFMPEEFGLRLKKIKKEPSLIRPGDVDKWPNFKIESVYSEMETELDHLVEDLHKAEDMESDQELAIARGSGTWVDDKERDVVIDHVEFGGPLIEPSLIRPENMQSWTTLKIDSVWHEMEDQLEHLVEDLDEGNCKLIPRESGTSWVDDDHGDFGRDHKGKQNNKPQIEMIEESSEGYNQNERIDNEKNDTPPQKEVMVRPKLNEPHSLMRSDNIKTQSNARIESERIEMERRLRQLLSNTNKLEDLQSDATAETSSEAKVPIVNDEIKEDFKIELEVKPNGSTDFVSTEETSEVPRNCELVQELPNLMVSESKRSRNEIH